MNQIYGNFVGKTAQLEIHILKVCLAKTPIKTEKTYRLLKLHKKKLTCFTNKSKKTFEKVLTFRS